MARVIGEREHPRVAGLVFVGPDTVLLNGAETLFNRLHVAIFRDDDFEAKLIAKHFHFSNIVVHLLYVLAVFPRAPHFTVVSVSDQPSHLLSRLEIIELLAFGRFLTFISILRFNHDSY